MTTFGLLNEDYCIKNKKKDNCGVKELNASVQVV